MKAGVVGLATALMVSGGVGLAGLPARFAPADPAGCAPGKSCTRWCPGDPDPAGRPIPWDASVCHDFYWDSAGVHDVGTGTFYAWSAADPAVLPGSSPGVREVSRAAK